MPVQRVVYVPHPDDETLSMALLIVDWFAHGDNVHVVFMNRGGSTGARRHINGESGCNIHGWRHQPAREGYDPLDYSSVGEARIHEGRTAIGLMATTPPPAGVPAGVLTWSEGGLPDDFGGVAKPPLASAVDACEAIMRATIEQFPDATHYTMSEGDGSPDHSACGFALRRLKASTDLVPGTTKTFAAVLAGTRFFISRLYWASSNGGVYPPDIWAASLHGPPDANGHPTNTIRWWDANSVGARYTELAGIIRTRVIGAYNAWNPAEGSYAVGYHSVRDQFTANFGPSAGIASLWHQ